MDSTVPEAAEIVAVRSEQALVFVPGFSALVCKSGFIHHQGAEMKLVDYHGIEAHGKHQSKQERQAEHKRHVGILDLVVAQSGCLLPGRSHHFGMVPDETKQHGYKRCQCGDEEVDFHVRGMFG